MEKKINIAELLKDCPQGMELDCTMYEDVCFDYVDELNIIHCYIQHEAHKTSITFNQHGIPNSDIKSKCVIFPKGKTTWKGFQRPFKDGDIIFVTNNESYESFHYKYIAIFKEIKRDKDVYVYGLYSYNEDVFSLHPYLCEITNSTIIKFATKEEKQKLFDAIKANGYKWNEETKTLEKLPTFKVGDKIKHKDTVLTIITVQTNNYIVEDEIDNFGILMFSQQDKWELVPNKFDITTLKPFDKVLVRDNSLNKWRIQFFEKYDKNYIYPFICIQHNKYTQCIPYENNEHLLDTTNDCDEFYKTWE